ncbi:PDZ domain-containing protein [bacterium]|nr:PDZ domain-containing protein [bacterium]
MRLLICSVMILVIVSGVSNGSSAWRVALDNLVSAQDAAFEESLLEELLDLEPSWAEVAARLDSLCFPDIETPGVPELRMATCIDGVERPWVIVTPDDYESDERTPMLVILHGGVGRADIVPDPLERVAENEFVAMAREHGWIAAVPFGQAGATWWEDVGTANIQALVRTVKREYNVDDDRVWMTGFSDGASAGFFFAMSDPTDYAAIVTMNGHMGVASLDGDRASYASNMAATPLYATTTFHDGLYPSERMRATLDMAERAGADIFYREFEGEHSFEPWGEEELPRIARFLERHSRDPFPSKISWEAAGGEFGLCRWFAIDETIIGKRAPWHLDYNAALVSDRITFGFVPDWEYEETGVLVSALSDGDYPATQMGMAEGDIIVAGNGTPVTSLDDLDDFKGTLARGDAFSITVERDGEELILEGLLPEKENYYIFKREVPSGAVRVRHSANRVDIKQSLVGSFRILVHPDMFNVNEPITVTVGDQVLFDGLVEPDLEFLLRNFLENRDRRLIYIAELEFQL